MNNPPISNEFSMVITRFAGTGKFQLLKHIAPCIFNVEKVFETEDQAYVYAAENSIYMEIESKITYK